MEDVNSIIRLYLVNSLEARLQVHLSVNKCLGIVLGAGIRAVLPNLIHAIEGYHGEYIITGSERYECLTTTTRELIRYWRYLERSIEDVWIFNIDEEAREQVIIIMDDLLRLYARTTTTRLTEGVRLIEELIPLMDPQAIPRGRFMIGPIRGDADIRDEQAAIDRELARRELIEMDPFEAGDGEQEPVQEPPNNVVRDARQDDNVVDNHQNDHVVDNNQDVEFDDVALIDGEPMRDGGFD